MGAENNRYTYALSPSLTSKKDAVEKGQQYMQQNGYGNKGYTLVILEAVGKSTAGTTYDFLEEVSK